MEQPIRSKTHQRQGADEGAWLDGCRLRVAEESETEMSPNPCCFKQQGGESKRVGE